MKNMEIGNLYFLIRDICHFLKKLLLRSPPSFMRLLLDPLNLIGCRGNMRGTFLKIIQTISSKKL